MKIVSILCISLILYFTSHSEVSQHLRARSIGETIGYIPERHVMKIISLNHKTMMSEWLFLKTIVYYGGKVEESTSGTKKAIDYPAMYKFMDVSTYIDPFNIDSYYFSQAIFPWEGMVKETNYLLERGLQHRTWDFYIPFFLSFNNFYFLKDYKNASRYMERAARLKREPLLMNLAARFMYETNQTELAIAFLKEMIENTWNEKVKKSLLLRLQALEAIDSIQKAMRQYERVNNKRPEDLRELIKKGFMATIPKDPYGGEFYIDKDGKIKTTSMLIQKKQAL